VVTNVKGFANEVLRWFAFKKGARRNRLLAKAEINPFYSVSPRGRLTLEEARRQFRQIGFRVPNVSGFYHAILRNYWERYGLGPRCLLVSETFPTSRVFQEGWPSTNFTCTDYYVDLQPEPQCDLVWNLCSPESPLEFRGTFSSVICQATLEHVLDPVQAVRNLSQALLPGGMLYIQTHTPAYSYHSYPRDYLRFFPDWFEDLGEFLQTVRLVELLCLDGHAFAVYRRL